MVNDPWKAGQAPQSPSDVSYCDLARATKDLEQTKEEIKRMVDEIAAADRIEESHSERMKQALARAVRRANEDSVAKGEVSGRCDPVYQQEVHTLLNEYEMARRTKRRFESLLKDHAALLTLISAQKEAFKL